MAKFVLAAGNRGFFPIEYMGQAREELPAVLKSMGHEVLMMDESATRAGAVETRKEGREFAVWLDEHKGYDGIIWTHPNFGDEVGMLPALREAGRRKDKILLHAYPDTMDKLGWDDRRDAFCGKMSTMDVMVQYGIEFVALAPHVVAPTSQRFKDNIDLFTRICAGEAKDPYVAPNSVVSTYEGNVLDGITLLALGARTTPFMTCRYDEGVAAANGITIETADLSLVMDKMGKVDSTRLEAKMKELGDYTCWKKALSVDPAALEKQARFAVVMDDYVAEYNPAAVGIRCWTEWQEIMKMSVCATLSHLNHGRSDGRRIPAACEVDIGNALTMYVLNRFSPNNAMVACQDWNNNWGENDDKFAFMHCGPHDTSWLNPEAVLKDGKRGNYVETQAILDHSFGPYSYGCIQGRFKPGPVTIGSASLINGKCMFNFLEGRVTEDVIPPEYFGSAGVCEVPGLQDALIKMGHLGFKHHFSMGEGHIADECIKQLAKHPGYEVYDLRPSK